MDAWLATSCAPRTSRKGIAASGPKSARTTTSGSRICEQPAEVALTGGGQERVDHLALRIHVDVWLGVLGPHTPARAAGELARRIGRAVRRPRAISSNGTPNMSWRTKASRSAGVSVSSTTSSARPDRVGEQRLVLRIGPVLAVDDRLGHVRGERLLASRRRASAACSARPARRPSSARRPGSRPRSRRRGSGEPTPPAPRRPPRSAIRASGRRLPAGAAVAPRTGSPANRAHSSVTFPPRSGLTDRPATPGRCDTSAGGGGAPHAERGQVEPEDGVKHLAAHSRGQEVGGGPGGERRRGGRLRRELAVEPRVGAGPPVA